MNEIIKSITEAEEKAAGIKAEALKKAAEIAAAAEISADEIEKNAKPTANFTGKTPLKKLSATLPQITIKRLRTSAPKLRSTPTRY